MTQEPVTAHCHMGHCPQSDAIFELLTGREHLELFARLHGILDAEVAQVTHYLTRASGCQPKLALFGHARSPGPPALYPLDPASALLQLLYSCGSTTASYSHPGTHPLSMTPPLAEELEFPPPPSS